MVSDHVKHIFNFNHTDLIKVLKTLVVQKADKYPMRVEYFLIS